MNGALEFILQSIADQLSLAKGDKSVLLQNLDQYLPELYEYSVSIMDVVVKPIAYSILGFFLLIELQQIAQRFHSSNASTYGLEMFMQLFLKVGICTMVMRNLALFLRAIMEIGIQITQGISNLGINISGDQTIDVSGAMTTVTELGFFSKLVLLIVLLVVFIIALLTNILVKVIVFMRFLELYVYLSISPMPIATLPNLELSQIGKNFFKSFVAAALQGSLLFIVLSFYPILVNSVFSFGGNDGVFEIASAIIGYCIALIFCLIYTGRWAKSITTAT